MLRKSLAPFFAAVSCRLMPRVGLGRFLGLAAIVTAGLRAGQSGPQESFPFLAPLPAIASYAAREKIPIEGIDPPVDAPRNQVGDSVVALVTLSDRGHFRQWLLRVNMVELTADERHMPPPSPEVFHTSTGSKFQFETARVALSLKLVGPVRDDQRADGGKRPAEKQARALVSAGFLRLGFDRAAAALMRVQAAEESGRPFNFGIAGTPFPPDAVAKNKVVADAMGLTPEEEQAFAGVPPALFAFFDVVQKTPGLREILFEMLDKPSLAWTALTHRGKLNPSIESSGAATSAVDTKKWGENLPAGYRLPISIMLNRKPALACKFIVTTPQAPLLASAGIIGLLVETPGNSERQLAIRLVAAKAGNPLSPAGDSLPMKR
jgi:hypothetical protein